MKDFAVDGPRREERRERERERDLDARFPTLTHTFSPLLPGEPNKG